MKTSACMALTLLVLVLLVRPAPAQLSAAPEPLLVVAGLTFPGAEISLQDLKSAFRGHLVSVSGTRLIPINHALESPLRVAFDKLVLGLKPAEVGRFWIDQRIRDTGKPPTTAPTVDLALRAAATLRGAITYARRSQLLPRLKVLRVDGKAAAEAGYPLAE
jgi:hypothetical protein